MPISAGTKLGPYEILALLGAGGMGEVWKARDTRLGRLVAIKVSREKFTERFDREAHAVAALNHANVCQLYDVGPDYLVMEYVEGSPVSAPDTTRKLLDIAVEMSEGLAAAHAAGILHRDLKPANVLITRDGRIKILDFGLAKPAHNAKWAPENLGVDDATRTSVQRAPLTDPGTTVGTCAYMSPEQARGQTNLTAQSDQFSLGLVIYELAAGKRAFQRGSTAETMAAIIREEAEPLPGSVPAPLRWIVQRLLHKEPAERYDSTRDLARELRQVRDHFGETTSGTSIPRVEGATPGARSAIKRPALLGIAFAAAAVLLVSTAVFAFLWRRTPAPEMLSAQFEINPPGGMHFTNLYAAVAVSPDGRYIVFGAAVNQGIAALWLRPRDSLAAQRLQRTESANFPFWSPDSKSIGFYQGGKLMRADIGGGPPRVLCDAEELGGAGGTWNGDGTILFNSGADIFRVPASGGVPQQITSLNKSRKEIASGLPQFLPDGKHFLSLVSSEDPGATGIYAISLDRPKERVWIMATNRKATYLAPRGGQPGYLLWVRGQTLLAQPFDAGKLKLEGVPVQVVEDVLSSPRAPTRAAFWGSDAGVLAYRTSAPPGSALTWFDRQGKELGVVGRSERYQELALSPDGSHISAFRADNIGMDLWLIDVARGSSLRLTTDPGNHSFPVWSPDGKQIAFGRLTRSSGGDLYRMPAGVPGAGELVLKNAGSPLDWSRDGRLLLLARSDSRTARADLWVLPMGEGDPKPVKYLATGFRLRNGSFSPDGHRVMYASNVSGREEVYVSPFPDASAAPSVQVSTDGGGYPRWRRDGRAIYYLSPTSKLVEVEVLPGSPFKVGIPKPLFDVRAPTWPDAAGWPWDISQDGRRFLFEIQTDQPNNAPLTVITNWQSRLKK
jgi:eukaryotic-like serine/threonine-protein kinase